MVQNIDLKQLKEMKCTDMVLVDVLPEINHKKMRIPRSINIPVDKIEEVAPIVLPDNQQHIVVYCANRQCQASVNAARKFEDLGYTNVYDYEDGLQGWQEHCGAKTDKEGCGCTEKN